MDAVVAGACGDRSARNRGGPVAVQAVVRGVQRQRAAGDRKRRLSLDALHRNRIAFFGRAAEHSIAGFCLRIHTAARRDFQSAAGNQHARLRLNAVAIRINRDRTAADINKALIRLGLCGLDAVAARRDAQRAAADQDTVVRHKAVVRRRDFQCAAGNAQVVLCGDRVVRTGLDAQRAAAVDR